MPPVFWSNYYERTHRSKATSQPNAVIRTSTSITCPDVTVTPRKLTGNASLQSLLLFGLGAEEVLPLRIFYPAKLMLFFFLVLLPICSFMVHLTFTTTLTILLQVRPWLQRNEMMMHFFVCVGMTTVISSSYSLPCHNKCCTEFQFLQHGDIGRCVLSTPLQPLGLLLALGAHVVLHSWLPADVEHSG